MKRVRSLLAILLLAMMFVSMLPVSAVADQKMKVTTNYLRLRTGPGMDYTVKGRLKKGTVVTVLTSRSSRHWYYVKTSSGVKGWVYKSYVKKTTLPTVAAAESASGTAVAQKNAYMRRGPSTNYERILTIKSGKTMKIIGRTGAWYKVRYNNRTGFVYRDLIKIAK